MRRVGLGLLAGTFACVAVAACSHEQEPEPVVVPPQPAQTAPAPAPLPAPAASSAPVATEEQAPEVPAAAPSTEEAAYIVARDPRAKGTPRSLALVEVEVRGLENLNTQASSPQIARRLMDGYAELARLRTGGGASDARTKAIAQADWLIANHPKYASLDEVRYYRALAFDQNGDLKTARSGYYELIKNSPQSKFIPHAYFAFGEMFFFEAKHGDPSKFALARQAFQEVLKYPPQTNSVHAFAKQKLAQTPP